MFESLAHDICCLSLKIKIEVSKMPQGLDVERWSHRSYV